MHYKLNLFIELIKEINKWVFYRGLFLVRWLVVWLA